MCTPALREDQNYKGLINWLADLDCAHHCEVYDTKILEFIKEIWSMLFYFYRLRHSGIRNNLEQGKKKMIGGLGMGYWYLTYQ